MKSKSKLKTFTVKLITYIGGNDQTTSVEWMEFFDTSSAIAFAVESLQAEAGYAHIYETGGDHIAAMQRKAGGKLVVLK